MKQVELQVQNHLEIDNIEGFLIRRVTKFGNGAKVDCPKEYLGRTIYRNYSAYQNQLIDIDFGLTDKCDY